MWCVVVQCGVVKCDVVGWCDVACCACKHLKAYKKCLHKKNTFNYQTMIELLLDNY